VTIVINLDEAERTVRVRIRGLDDCVVKVQSMHHESPLRAYYERPSRASAGAYVNELLALTVSPSRPASEFATLPEHARVRLRRAVAVAAGRGKQWRRLHGSHLTGDERLLSVMFWRWQQWENFRVRIRTRYLENQKAAAVAADGARISLAGNIGQAEASLRRVADAVALTRFTPASLGVVSSLTANLEAFTRVSDFTRSISAITSLTDTFKMTSALAGIRPEPFAFRVPGATDFALGTGAFGGIAGLSAAASSWTSIADTPQLLHGALGVNVVSAALAGLRLPEFPAFQPAGLLVREFERMREWQDAQDAVERFERRWQTHALSYLVLAMLGCCTVWEAAKLATLTDDEVERVVLDAVEAVVRDGEFVRAMRSDLAGAPLLRRLQRAHLDHMLEHAAAGEWVNATAPLYAGVEGAFWAAGYGKLVVTLERTYPNKPTKSMAFDSMVKLLPVPKEFKTLMNRGLYGTVGNAFRHGDADDGERRQVLLGIVALAGWFEHFANRRAFIVLAERATDALPAALKFRETLTLPPGEPSA